MLKICVFNAEFNINLITVHVSCRWSLSYFPTNSMHTFLIPHPHCLPSFDHCNNILWRIYFVKLEAMKKRKVSFPCRELNPGRPTRGKNKMTQDRVYWKLLFRDKVNVTIWWLMEENRRETFPSRNVYRDNWRRWQSPWLLTRFESRPRGLNWLCQKNSVIIPWNMSWPLASTNFKNVSFINPTIRQYIVAYKLLRTSLN
jgi:hypothetical protein